uniref:EGF-like domain-containing protein n=1 Tax=Timema cristinae TaxID=61476 RepID=A0A7R9CSC2_TIMCR|nr:unnamed protein product [Timema cristinae]
MSFYHHARAGIARATVLSLPVSPSFLPTPSYVRMRTTVKHHFAGTVKRTIATSAVTQSKALALPVTSAHDKIKGETMTSSHGVVIVILGLVSVFYLASCDLEPTFTRCCTLGSDWFESSKECKKFPAPVAGVSAEQQSICLSAVEICCLRSYRHQQCINGKGSAKSGNDCIVTKEIGGEYHKDCCEACKLGIISASMNMGCQFETFSFGLPWDKAYLECCVDEDQFVPPIAGNATRKPATPVIDNLCNFLEGELCAHICVPTPGSYRCECREGFSLMSDGKSCQQKDLPDRCKLNNPCSHKCLDTGIAIECSCHPGYELGQDERSCLDIDECSLHVDTCDPNFQICKNEHGKYVCINPDGSVERPHVHTQPGNHNQSDNRSQPGSSPGSTNAIQSGKCPVGYQYNSKAQVCDGAIDCPDLDLRGNQPRSVVISAPDYESRSPRLDFRLRRLPASFTNREGCAKWPGNSLHQRPSKGFDWCRSDIDECQLKLDNCESDSSCQNNIGSFACIRAPMEDCPPGYIFKSSERVCHEDINECEEGLDNCDQNTQLCINTEGSFHCEIKGGMTQCPAGYKMNKEQRKCEDVDECKENLHSCMDETEICRNNIGAYECDIKCKAGFLYDIELRSCVGTMTLKNTHGTEEKGRQNGNSRKKQETEDKEITQCEAWPRSEEPSGSGTYGKVPSQADKLVLANRNKLATTSEGVGRFNFTLEGADSRKYISYVDECREGLHACEDNEDCFNEEGSYRCEQKQRNNEKCPLGYSYSADRKACLDVNECLTDQHNCTTASGEICVNIQGSFLCQMRSCPQGFTFNTRLTSCDDVDECVTGQHNCSASEGLECVNLIGSFQCKIVSCREGFRLNTITSQCEDLDECVLNTANCSPGEKCINEIGGFWCNPLCGSGYKINPVDSASCLDIDECQEGIDNCNKKTNMYV